MLFNQKILIKITPYYALNVVARPLARLADLLAIEVQDERDRNERNRQEPQRRAGPVHTQIIVHRRGEQGEARTKRGPHEVIPGQDGRRILGVRIAQVGQDSIEEQHRTHGEEAGPNDRRDPVHRFSCRPPEEEQTNGNEERANHGRRKPFLGLDDPILELLLLDEVQVQEVAGDGNERADKDTYERETLGAEREAVDADEGDGEGLEPDVQDAVDERDVEVHAQHDGLRDGELERTDKRHEQDVLGRHVLRFNLGFALELVIASELAETATASVKDVGGAGLGQEEEDDD